jgi:hypothetical protein
MPEEPWEWVRVTTGKGTEATYYNVASIKIVRVHRRGINPRATVCWMIAARDSETTLGGAQAQALLDYLDARIALGAEARAPRTTTRPPSRGSRSSEPARTLS